MDNYKWLLIILISAFLIHSHYTAAVFGSTNSSISNNWMMFRHDPNHNAFTNSTGPTNSATNLWTYKTQGMVISSPAVANGYLVVGSRDWDVYCLNSSNGKLLWIYSTENEVNSSPAIHKNSVYIASEDGQLYCLDITKGTLLWKTTIGGKTSSSPTIFEDCVYVGSGEHDVFCFNASDGTKMWSYPTSKGIQSSLAISDGSIYFASNDFFVYSINASTGSEKWYTHTGSVTSSPSIYNGQVYIGSNDGYVYSLNASTGSKIWEFQTKDSVSSSPAVAYRSVYVGCEDNNVYCLNAFNGEKIWQASTGYWVKSSPVVAEGNVYVGSEDYNIYCFNAFTGEKKWSYTTENYVDSSPAIVDNNLFVGSSDWNIYALNLADSNNNPNQFQTFNTLLWTTIVFDIVFIAILLTIIFVIFRFVLLNRKEKHQTNLLEMEDYNQSWFSAHAESLCILGILLFSIIFFINLENGPLWVSDEKTYSQWAFHMLQEGDYLTPWAFGKVYLWIGKPPLFIWLLSVAYQLFGVNNFASRIWSPIFGTLSLIMVFYLGKKLYNLHVGFISAIVLGLFSSFYVFARLAMIDIPFIFFMLSSMYFVLLAEKEDSSKYAALGGLFFGLAFLTKQITAVLIPLIFFFYFLIAGKGIWFLFKKKFANFWKTVTLIVSPWMIYMILRFGPEFWENYFIYSGFIRSITPIEGHVGGYLYYFESLIRTENFFLVILLAVSFGFCVYNSVIKRSKEDSLLLVWMVIVFLVFTFAQTKLEWYILPAFPAFAIAISSFLYKLIEKIRSFAI